MKTKLLFCICILLVPLTAWAAPAAIQRVEPPNWWTGYKETGLQLMVYGNQIAMYEPSVDYPGVTIERVEKVDSPNYREFFMLPFGGTRENGGHKGTGFALIADMMAGILSGNGPGFQADDGRHSLFVMAIRIDAFLDADRFKTELDELLATIAGMEPISGQERVYYAGLIEHEEAQRRRRAGIPYHRDVVDWFNQTAADLDLGFSLP